MAAHGSKGATIARSLPFSDGAAAKDWARAPDDRCCLKLPLAIADDAMSVSGDLRNMSVQQERIQAPACCDRRGMLRRVAKVKIERTLNDLRMSHH